MLATYAVTMLAAPPRPGHGRGPAVGALRALLVGGPTARPVLLAVAWTAGLAAVFVLLAVRRYRRG